MSDAVLPGLCSISFRDLEPAAIITLASDAGLAGIEWGADGHVPVGDHDTAGKVAALCAAQGLSCPSYGTYLGVDPSKGTAADACATAVSLGADNLRVWTPFGTDHTADAETRAAIVAELTATAALAAEHGLTVGVEFHGWTLTHTAGSAVRLIEDVGAPNLFTYWQPVYWEPDVNLDPERQLAEFDLVAEHLAHIHTYWWIGMDRHPLADGEATWREVLHRAGAKARWTKPRYAFLEYVPDDVPELLVREAATLNSWIGATA